MSNSTSPLTLPAHVVDALRVHVQSPEFAERFPNPADAHGEDAADFFTNWWTDEAMDEFDANH